MFEKLFKKNKKNEETAAASEKNSAEENTNKDSEVFNLTLEQIKREFSEKCVKISFDSIDENIFASKLGGFPYLPKGESFPLDANQKQMQLLLQINCADLVKFDFCQLPKTGILQFFIAKDRYYGWDSENPTEQTGFKVRYFEQVDTGVSIEDVKARIVEDEENKARSPILAENIRLVFEEGISTISINNENFDDIFVEKYNKNYGEDKIETYFDLDNAFIDKITKDLGDFESKTGGYPGFCQDDPRCAAADYSDYDYLLLQLESDSTNLQFGDDGIANFFIPKNTLQNADFTKVLYNWDCY